LLGELHYSLNYPYCAFDHLLTLIVCPLLRTGLMNLVRTTTDTFELSRIITTLTMDLLSEYVTTRVACLHWLYMLHEKDPAKMNAYIGDLLPALLKTISDSADEVVLINLQVSFVSSVVRTVTERWAAMNRRG
jgi:hypothetical protein